RFSNGLVDLIVSKAEGNPFFLEELARTVREQVGRSPSLAVPDTVQEVLLGRIDRLAAEDRRLLEVAAVVGKDVSFSIVRLGAKAYSRSAHREAVSYCEQALDALARLPESRERTEHAIDLRFDLRNALQPLGEFPRILEFLREAEQLGRALDDQRRLGQVSAFMTGYFRLMG